MTGAERRRRAVWGKIRAVRCEDIKEWCMRRLPILEWGPVYDWKENLVPDMVSGMMLAIQQVTQGLAFAALSSVHPVFGLYGSFFPVIIYAIFGMGRHVATGTFALTSLISANAVERLVPSTGTNFTANNNSGILGLSEFEMQRIGVAAAVSFLGGIIQVVMFMLQLGHATFLLTEPVISAMTTGAATHVVTSQVKYLLGMKMPYISGPLGFFHELLAHGLSNVIPSFFFCIPSAAAMGRTALLYSTGARTQVACLISCALVLVVIYVIGAVLYWLPMCVLASIIIVGLKGMLMQFRDLKKYWNMDKIDWSIWVTTYMFTICFAANVGLLYGVVCTIVIVIFRFPRAKTLNLKNMEEVEYKYKTEDNCESLKQVKIVSVSNPLVFLNARKFHADLMKIIQKDSTSSQACEDVNKCEQNTLLCSFSNGGCHGESLQPRQSERRILILDCSGLNFFDYTGVSMLLQVLVIPDTLCTLKYINTHTIYLSQLLVIPLTVDKGGNSCKR
uniref:Solute carrier family 26 member 7 n=1 Tax=Meleagris gallopavo TaxID=9103 RepID=A0A803XYR9_MELGA